MGEKGKGGPPTKASKQDTKFLTKRCLTALVVILVFQGFFVGKYLGSSKRDFMEAANASVTPAKYQNNLLNDTINTATRRAHGLMLERNKLGLPSASKYSGSKAYAVGSFSKRDVMEAANASVTPAKHQNNLLNDAINTATRRAHGLMLERNKLGLPSASKYSGSKPYAVESFRLSQAHEAGYAFEFKNSMTKSISWSTESEIQKKDAQQFICEIDMSSQLMQHFPHFAQAAFPCLSGLLEVMEINGVQEQNRSNVKYGLALNDPNFFYYDKKEPNKIGSESHKGGRDWIDGFLASMRSMGVDVFNNSTSILYGDNVWLVQPTDTEDRVRSGASFPAERDFVIESTKTSTKRYELENTKFLSKQRDAEWLQKAVLGGYFHQGPSDEYPLRVLIIDRAGSNRHWIFSGQTKKLLESSWNTGNETNVLEVRILSNPKGNLTLQAKAFHEADIIISSHGAQLTNLAFIRPCTAVIELFSHGYYLGFFQPLVVAAEGLSYDGYIMDINPRDNEGLERYDIRVKRRGANIFASPESIEYAFPRILLDHFRCRENWPSN